MYKQHVGNKNGPPAALAIAGIASCGIQGLNHGIDSSLPVTIVSMWLVPKTIHLFPPSSGSLIFAFPLSPRCLVLITLSQLQVAPLLYLGISLESYRM